MTSKCRVEIWKLTGDDVTLAIAPFAGGAAGTLTYFAAPLVGAKIVLLEEFTPEGALEMIQKEKVTAIGVVPTHVIRMLEQDLSKYDLSSLRFIRSAGGYLAPKVAMEAEERLGGRITSDLGTQDVGSVSGCSIDDPGDVRRRTVGKPLRGTESSFWTRPVRRSRTESRASCTSEGRTLRPATGETLRPHVRCSTTTTGPPPATS